MEDIPVERNTEEDLHCTLVMHTRYRSLRRTDMLVAKWDTVTVPTSFPDALQEAASQTIGDVKTLNKLARQLKSQPVKLQFWPLTGPFRIIGFPDASYRNNDDRSSQRGMTMFFELRERSSKDGMSHGSLVDYESQKMERTVLSTSVAELYSVMEVLVHASSSEDCGWTCQVRLQKFTWELTRRICEQQQNISLIWTNADNLHDFHVASRKPVQEVFMILLTFHFQIVWQIV